MFVVLGRLDYTTLKMTLCMITNWLTYTFNNSSTTEQTLQLQRIEEKVVSYDHDPRKLVFFSCIYSKKYFIWIIMILGIKSVIFCSKNVHIAKLI